MVLPVIHKNDVIIVVPSLDIGAIWLVRWHTAVCYLSHEVSQYLVSSRNRIIKTPVLNRETLIHDILAGCLRRTETTCILGTMPVLVTASESFPWIVRATEFMIDAGILMTHTLDRDELGEEGGGDGCRLQCCWAELSSQEHRACVYSGKQAHCVKRADDCADEATYQRSDVPQGHGWDPALGQSHSLGYRNAHTVRNLCMLKSITQRVVRTKHVAESYSSATKGRSSVMMLKERCARIGDRLSARQAADLNSQQSPGHQNTSLTTLCNIRSRYIE